MRVRYRLNNITNQYYKHETGASEFEKNYTFTVNLRSNQRSTL